MRTAVHSLVSAEQGVDCAVEVSSLLLLAVLL